MLLYYVFTLDSIFKWVPPKGSELTWQTSLLYSYIVLLIYVNETILFVWKSAFLQDSCQLFYGLGWLNVISMHDVSEGPGAILWVFKHFLSLISRLLGAILGFPSGSDGKASVYNAGDPGSIPGLGRSPAEGNGSPLQYSCLENPMDCGAW